MMDWLDIEVGPAQTGWRVGCDLPLQPTYFHSGARAEAMARRLAIQLSEAGLDVRLRVNDRAARPIAIYNYPGL